MKLAVLSDSHDAWGNLEWAVQQAKENNCEVILFAGDLNAPPGCSILAKFEKEVNMIFGNNEGEKMGMTKLVNKLKINHHDWWFEGELGGKQIIMHHWPRPIEIAAQSQMFDLAICGHTHEWRLEKIGKTVLLNPGALIGYKEPASMAIVDLETMEVNRLLKN